MENKDKKTEEEGIGLVYQLAEAMEKNTRATSLMDSVNAKIGKMKDEIHTHDDYYNSLLAIGSKDPSHQFDSYSLDNDTLNWMLWTTLYSESWIFRRAIDKPAQDEVSPGICVRGIQNDELADRVYNQYEEHKQDFVELLSWGALYGGSVAVMMFDGIPLEEMDKPIDFRKINRDSKHLIRMYVTDRWYGCAPSYSNVVSNVNNIDFGKPMFYNISFADGRTFNIHHSYILRYEHRMAPKFIKNGQLSGWGYAEGAHILNELMRDDKLKASIQSLIDKSCIEIIKMQGMRGIFMGGDPNNNKQLQKRLDMVNWARNFNSLTFLDKDDDYQMNGFQGLNGLAQLLEQNMWLVSAALEMQGVLYGHLNNGFSGDEDAMQRYDQVLQSRKDAYVRPVIAKFLKVLYRVFGIEADVRFFFRSLIPEIQVKNKVDSISAFAGLMDTMMRSEYLTKENAAEAMKRFVEHGDIDFRIGKKEVLKQAAKAALDKSENIGAGMEMGNAGGGNGNTLDLGDLGSGNEAGAMPSAEGAVPAAGAEGGGGGGDLASLLGGIGGGGESAPSEGGE